METRALLIKMLEQLLEDSAILQHQGAGYYSCIPVARRYNKLLAQARTLLEEEPVLIETFDDMPEDDPKDPGEKMKVVQGIRIEIGQLLTLLREEGKDNV